MAEWRCLSLTTPWPFAVLHCGKRIENRLSWRSCSYRGSVLLHASNPPGAVLTWWRRRQDDPSYEATSRQSEELFEWRNAVRDWIEWATLDGLTLPEKVTLADLLAMTGHIVGVVSIVGVVQPDGTVTDDSGPLRRIRQLTESERRWWMGGFALVLDNARAVKPVACKGALGFWRPPASVLDELGLEAA